MASKKANLEKVAKKVMQHHFVKIDTYNGEPCLEVLIPEKELALTPYAVVDNQKGLWFRSVRRFSTTNIAILVFTDTSK